MNQFVFLDDATVMLKQNVKGIGCFRGQRDALEPPVQHPRRRIESECAKFKRNSNFVLHQVGSRSARLYPT